MIADSIVSDFLSGDPGRLNLLYIGALPFILVAVGISIGLSKLWRHSKGGTMTVAAVMLAALGVSAVIVSTDRGDAAAERRPETTVASAPTTSTTTPRTVTQTRPPASRTVNKPRPQAPTPPPHDLVASYEYTYGFFQNAWNATDETGHQRACATFYDPTKTMSLVQGLDAANLDPRAWSDFFIANCH